MKEPLAIDGGTPVRKVPLPYGRQHLDETDIAAVVEVLRSEWLTTGPEVERFERTLAEVAGAADCVALCNGTAALHAAMYALGIGPGDEVIVASMTFAASANCVAFVGGTPVFADVDADTLLADPRQVEARITANTKAVIAVDYAGQACDYDRLQDVALRHGLCLVDDACHAIGGSYRGRPVGSLAALNTFSFHPVKHVTTGEGGAVTTDDPDLARRMQLFRNHGISADFRRREAKGSCCYEMVDLGFNYRISDIHCALGTSQLARLPQWVSRRQAIAARYDSALADLAAVHPLGVRSDVSHAYHLYVVQFELEMLRAGREEILRALRAEGIGANVHFMPVHLHPYYRDRFGTRPGLCPVAEAAYARIVSLPMFPTMSDRDADDVIRAVEKVVYAFGR